ncbi:hypothetical protein [Pseudoalteromonas lipolytica]|uniref:hypothetical protein n=1 Tax=Pseudoalteromonas lipolytica TaxID=570156 RepID=UPI003A972313
MLPALFGVSISQINLFSYHDCLNAYDRLHCWLYYSDRLIEFSLGYSVLVLQQVILPALSKLHSTKST